MSQASSTNISKHKFKYNRPAMMEAFTTVEMLVYAPGVITGYPDPAENQILNPDYNKDHLSDEAVEYITLPPPIIDFTVANPENQFSWEAWKAGFDTTDDLAIRIIAAVTQLILGGGSVVLALSARGSNIVNVKAGGNAALSVNAQGANKTDTASGTVTTPIIGAGNVINSEKP